jgi:hypothetical protein
MRDIFQSSSPSNLSKEHRGKQIKIVLILDQEKEIKTFKSSNQEGSKRTK